MIHCDIKTCVGCRMCEVACSSFHFGAVSPALARIRVAKREETGLDMAIACVSCFEKPCMDCPDGALVSGEGGEILLHTDRCNACEACVAACPIGAVGFYDGRPLICDLCGGTPACVDGCPTQALSYHNDYRDVRLQTCQTFTGNPSEKRARYARIQGEPIRESWGKGARVDS